MEQALEENKTVTAKEEPIKKKRLDYIDVCKFIGIFLVTYCHIKEKGMDVDLIYSFHLPMFFVLAGFTLNVDMPFKDYLFKKVKGYLVPLLFMDLLSVLVDLGFILYYKDYSRITIQYFLGQIGPIVEQNRINALWFICALFIGILASYPLIKIGKKYKWLILLTFAGSLAWAIFFNNFAPGWINWSFDTAFFAVPFIIIGFLLKWVVDKFPIMMKGRLIPAGIGILLMGIGILLAYIALKNYNKHLEMWGGTYKPYWIVLPSAFLGAGGIIFLAKSLSNPVMAELGKGNIVVLALQQSLGMRLWANVICKDWHEALKTMDNNCIDRYGYAILGVLLTFALSYLVYYFIVFTPLAFTINQKQRKLPFFRKKKENAAE